MTALHIRLTGIVSILAGICIFSGGSIHYFLHNPFGHWIMYAGDILLVFTLTGLYALQSRQSGILGLIGYIFSVTGTMIISVSSFLILADVYGLTAAHDTWMFMYFDAALYLPGLYLKLLGFALFGIASAYAGVLPRWSGILFALVPAAGLPGELISGMVVLYLVSVTLALVSLNWMGIYLFIPGSLRLSSENFQTRLNKTS
jgi:hypothetical protein